MLRIAVIGSGLSATILARRLAAFAQVTIFERGGQDWEAGSTGGWTGHPVGMAATLANGLGGTTNLWHGGLMRISEREFGDHWPQAARADVERHVAEGVREIYGEPGLALFERLQGVELGGGVWGDVLVKPAAFRARLAYPIPGVELRLNSRVTALEPRRSGVEIVFRQGGLPHRRAFDLAIVAAGTFGSAELLLRSGLGGDCVGRHLHDHPMGFVAKIQPDAAGAEHVSAVRARLPRRSEIAYKVADAQTGLVSAFYLRPAAAGPLRSDPCRDAAQVFAPGRRLRLSRALPRLADPDFRRIAASRTFGDPPKPKIHYVLAFTEQEPMGQGRVTLGRDGPEAAWTISEQAVAALARNLARFAASFGTEPILPDEPLVGRLWSGAHHSGTCRLSDGPANGVVDETLAVHGQDRIFVCDGSVVPASGATNTGATIAALAVRLSKHLRGELAGPRARGALVEA